MVSLLLRLRVVWLCLLTASAYAGNAPDECFCMVRSADPAGAILRGCQAYKAGTDFYATAVCTDPETGQKSEQTITEEWQQIATGADRCNPCRQVRGPTDVLPRPGSPPKPSPLPAPPAGQESTR
jgi:hypothetical protein